VGSTEYPEKYICPRCAAPSTKRDLVSRVYRCAECDLQVAQLDFAHDGSVAKFLAWLQPTGRVLQERYRITAALGVGGFAATYLAEDLLLKGKRRAIKEIPKARYDSHETDLLSRLQHPAIPDITDRFERAEFIYLVLQFGGSRTLESERVTRGGTIDVATLIPWMLQLCDALAYLHTRTPPVVHRDLKPENILLDERSNITLIDFGIAKESDGRGRTRAIARCVSHGFSPPEQELGTGTDQRSDVYALGATMYTLLTGTLPTPSNDRLAGGELIRPNRLNATIPPSLDTAILRALELNASRRQQTISELGSALKAAVSSALAPGFHASDVAKGARIRATVADPAFSETAMRLEQGTSRSRLGGGTANTRYSQKAGQKGALRRVLTVSGFLTLLAGTSFGTSYLYSNPDLQRRLGVAAMFAKLPGAHSRDQTPLDFRLLTLRASDGAGVPVSASKDTFSTAELQKGQHLSWVATFTNQMAGESARNERVQARILDPTGRELGSSTVNGLVTAEQSSAEFAGVAALSDTSQLSLGTYRIVLYVDDHKLVEQHFYVIEDLAAKEEAEAAKATAEAEKWRAQKAQFEAEQAKAKLDLQRAEAEQAAREADERRAHQHQLAQQQEQARIDAEAQARAVRAQQAEAQRQSEEQQQRLSEQQRQAAADAAARQQEQQRQQQQALDQARQQALINQGTSILPLLPYYLRH
jgi:hypothetical protein